MNNSIDIGQKINQSATYNQANKQIRGRNIEVKSLDKIESLSPESYLINNLIYQGSKVILHGPSNSGKTSMAIHLGMSIARGIFWTNQETEQSRVIFITADLDCRIKNQINAYECMYVQLMENVDFHLIKERINLANRDHSFQRLKNTIETLSRDKKPDLIIFDTLSACMAGADPNNSKDISRVLSTIDELQSTYGIAVLLVDDTGKDAKHAFRGNSALSAAADTSIAISTTNRHLRKLTVTKQRYVEIIRPISFVLPAILLGEDKHGDSITSCVVQTWHDLP